MQAPRKERALRAKVIESVAARQEVSPHTTRTMLLRWLEDAPAGRQEHDGRQREALARAIALWPETQRDIEQQRRIILESEPLRRRWLSVWAKHIVRDPAFLEQEIVPLYEGARDPELIACIDGVVLRPLAAQRHAGVYEFLTRTIGRDPTDSASALRRRLALWTLRLYAGEPERAREIAAALGERFVRSVISDEQTLAARVSTFLSTSAVEVLAGRVAEDAAVAEAVADGLPQAPPAALAEAVFAKIRENVSSALAAVVASAAPRIICSLPLERRDELFRWVLRSCGENRDTLVRRSAIGSLAAAARQYGGTEQITSAITTLLALWARADDDLWPRIGHAIVDLLKDASVDAELRGAIETPAIEAVLRQRSLEIRKCAVQILIALWPSNPDRLAETIGRLLSHFEEVPPTTDDLVNLAGATHFVIVGDPLRTWRFARRLIDAGQRIGLNVGGWNSVAAALASAIRAALGHPAARIELLAVLPRLPERMQYKVLHVARRLDDTAFRDKVGEVSQRLQGVARELHTKWVKQRPIDLEEDDAD